MSSYKLGAVGPSTFDKLSMNILLLSPFLQSYGWGKYNMSLIFTSILGLICVFSNLPKNPIPKFVTIYLGYWFISNLISSTSILDIFHFGIIRTLIIYYLFFACFKLEYFITIYRKIVCFFVGYFFIQEFFQRIIGVKLPSLFSFLPICVSDDADGLLTNIAEGQRNSSFFSEPAILVQFILPILAFELLCTKIIPWKRVIFLVLALLFLQSGNALLGLLILGVMFAYKLLFIEKIKYKFLIIVSSIFFLVPVAAIYLNSSLGQSVLERGKTIKSDSVEKTGYVSSGFVRIYRGYFVFAEYAPIYKFIGNDHPNYQTQSASNSEVRYLFNDGELYFNSIQHVLIYTGYIGTFIFMIMLYKLWKDTTYGGKTILLIIFGLSFISFMFFTPLMAFYLLIPHSLKKGHSLQF
ncbi:hypothetical protein [uncultured Bacteroides sp.]|uniref:hypothetical protein n=1 Tax=uncultured Bacteroides sp. TaxID=162156 RepID=UPI0025DA8C08|nr:hypothetical protein [uncultured Bacteroides sp.]